MMQGLREVQIKVYHDISSITLSKYSEDNIQHTKTGFLIDYDHNAIHTQIIINGQILNTTSDAKDSPFIYIYMKRPTREIRSPAYVCYYKASIAISISLQ